MLLLHDHLLLCNERGRKRRRRWMRRMKRSRNLWRMKRRRKYIKKCEAVIVIEC